MAKTKPRKVFGRIKRNIDGHDYVLELTRDGLRVRRKWSREPVMIGFESLTRWADGRFL
jgi:hypothetical protein